MIEITKPTNPINPRPRAETFATVVNSNLEGFFKSFQTLEHCATNDFMLNIFYFFILFYLFNGLYPLTTPIILLNLIT